MHRLVEERIREAIERGDFDNLPNKGQPIDLRAWKKTPEHLRMAYSVLKRAGVTPDEVSAKKQIAALKGQISRAADEKEKTRLRNRLNALLVTHSIQMERLKKR